jgi:hypothetical protein
MPGWLAALGGGRLIAAALAVAAVIAAGAWLYLAGRDSARVDGLEGTVTAVGRRNDVDRAIDRLPDGAAADRLRRDWARD